ncbi:TPA: hypothetical protein ACMDXH_003367 [Vibrio parahaemolyticus]|nr:hypothetical protein [Vibrio parahaemolyticus]EGQ8842711.1 hypothetical protein [Vibrio parahaemolyticus]EGQ9511310.1 hypothetical protein [Vibrio parahaemolyticus]EJG0017548.1 hypothetical protein [Vibrio parahaemolyticus]
MSKKVKLGVVSALSVAVLAGCQSTGNQTQQVEKLKVATKTEAVELFKADTYEYLSVEIDEPIQFEVPLDDTVDCGLFDSKTKGKKGTFNITKVESIAKNHGRYGNEIVGYVSSDELDVTECRPYGVTYHLTTPKVRVTKTFSDTVLPKLVELTREQIELKHKAEEAAKKAAVEKEKQDQLANWHKKELSDTAFAIGGIEVCMEKGTYFLPTDRRAKKVIDDWKSYARNDIYSKVDGKHYWDKSVYQQRRQAALALLRNSWENDYLSFSNMCASLRNVVDSETNK